MLCLLRSIDGFLGQLAQEYFLVRIEEFLDYGEDVLRSHSDFSVFHSHILFLFCSSAPISTNRVPAPRICQSVSTGLTGWRTPSRARLRGVPTNSVPSRRPGTQPTGKRAESRVEGEGRQRCRQAKVKDGGQRDRRKNGKACAGTAAPRYGLFAVFSYL